jgi:hypothetical protein
MCGSRTPKRASSNRISDEWSNVSEQTYPPAVHGETTTAGSLSFFASRRRVGGQGRAAG